MINTIREFTQRLWQSRGSKSTNNKWVSANAVCCAHNGETVDKRRRGGMLFNADGSVSYHCFNCHYTASYQPGRHLTYKFRKLLAWMGAEQNDIHRLVIDAIRVCDLVGPPQDTKEHKHVEINFKPVALPPGATLFTDIILYLESDESGQISPEIKDKIAYVLDRKIDINKYNFYVSADKMHMMPRRVIIPCYWKNKLIGYTGRGTTNKVIPKYFNQYAHDYVFNVDIQKPEWKFVVVCEGPFDAMSVDGVAVLTNEISEAQADIIESLRKEVVVVPDSDSSGDKIIEYALKYGWSVSFPVWAETCKDINEAVVKYGKLFTLKAIVDARESNALKIKLLSKQAKRL